MAGELFVDDAGQVFRKTTDGLQYVGPAQQTKPEAGAQNAVGNALLRGAIRGAAAPADLATLGAKAMMSADMPEHQPPAAGALPAGRYGGYIPPANAPLQKPDALKQAVRNFTMPSETLSAPIDRPPPGGARYIEEATAGALGGALTPGGGVATRALSGAAGGTGGEASANLVEDTPLNRVVGAILGGLGVYPVKEGAKLAASFAGAKSTETPKIVSQAAKGITDADFAQAEKLLAEAKTRGVQLTPIQALEKVTGLTGLQEKATASEKGGAKLTEFLAKQNEQAHGAAQGFLGGISAETDPGKAALAAQRAATGHIESIDKGITKQVNPYYATKPEELTNWGGRGVPLNVADAKVRLSSEAWARQIAANADTATEAGQAITALSKQVARAKSVSELNTLYNEWKQGLAAKQLNNTPITDYTAGQVKKRGLSVLDSVLGELQVDRKGGQQLYHTLETGVADPARRSLTGQIAGPRGVIEDVPTATTRILNLADSPNVRAQSILKTQQDFERAGQPEAFPKLVRAVIEKKLETAFKGAEGGRSAPAASSTFASSVWGTAEQPAKRANFEAMIAGAAKSNGVDPTEAVASARNLMQVMEAAGRAKGGMASLATGSGHPVESLYFRGGPGASPSLQMRTLGRIDEMLRGKAYGEIADMLTSPEGMKELRALAKFDLKSYRMGAVSGAAGAAVTQGAKENQ